MKYGMFDTIVLKCSPIAWECSKCGWDSEKYYSNKPIHDPLDDAKLLDEYTEKLRTKPNWFKTPVSLGTKVIWTPEDGGKPMERLVCPECRDHPQRSISDVHDCKNEFTIAVIMDGMIKYKTVSQCGCCSNAHGLRK